MKWALEFRQQSVIVVQMEERLVNLKHCFYSLSILETS